MKKKKKKNIEVQIFEDLRKCMSFREIIDKNIADSFDTRMMAGKLKVELKNGQRIKL